MQLHTFSFLDQYHHGPIFNGFLELRYRVLVENLGWELSHDGVVEMDQYDHPKAVYSIVTNKGQVVAGARALPCNASWGGWSYMLKDAALQKLKSIPDDLLDDCPDTANTWECTRLVTDDTNLAQLSRMKALRMVVHGLCKEAGKRGANDLISLSPSSFGRLLEIAGYSPVPLGRQYAANEDGRHYRVFRMPCDRKVNAIACEGLDVELSICIRPQDSGLSLAPKTAEKSWPSHST
ncbi:acyl-homoserine-lactone synthase [Parasedimentitalea huanghaiensis]|uniref:Acyl-homoserine-lactone synthase n=1 Tax=Parasedimentitalea huanghaiensis TaxID=2682100 RepID=A0A6L6WHN4_9RHOB|nr:acyl-homoserine-lactone synthase [Zongyanglinia huanghaiensis]MVO16821.1 hypothetical protein [Zongyanglinia huanghaiensis]